MKLETIRNEILEYLNKHGSVNTFRLSKDLRIDRSELINLVKELTNERLVKFKFGLVRKGDNEELASQKVIKTKELKEETPTKLPKPTLFIPETSEMSEIARGAISCASAHSKPAISEHAQKHAPC